MTLGALAADYPLSHINVDDPERSQGLTAAEAEARLARDGPNVLSPPQRISKFAMLVKHFSNPFLVLLFLGSILSYIGYGVNGERDALIVACLILTVVIVSGLMSFYQELSSSRVQNLFSVGRRD